MRLSKQLLFILPLLTAGCLWQPFGFAHENYTITGENPLTGQLSKVQATGVNIPRADNTLILYTPEYGSSTRSNAYGVEITAIKKNPKATVYHISKISSVWECEKQSTLHLCGNSVIPPQGIVLSASGDKRTTLLNQFKLNQPIQLDVDYFSTQTLPLNVINPTPENNPGGSGFPGYRAGQQLVLYDAGSGRPNTSTNEFGFEVTVKNGIVVAQEGADSAIPADGYILSGHGKARNWLIDYAPIGAKITLNVDPKKPTQKQVTATVDLSTYLYQLSYRMNEVQSRLAPNLKKEYQDIIASVQAQESKTLASKSDQQLALLAKTTLDKLNQQVWKTYEPFGPSGMMGVWVRPTEKRPQEIARTLDVLKEAGFNSVFLETFFHGYTIFPSETYTRYGLEANQNPNFKDLDLLKAWLDAAHQRGMKVHIWFQTFYGGTKAFKPPGPILKKYPSWANVQYVAKDSPPPVASNLELGAYFLDPANPETRKFLLSLISEIVTRYPIDGFQLDYIRYPASFPPNRFSYLKTSWGYTEAAREQFQAQKGLNGENKADPALLTPENADWESWKAFKQEQVTSFVAEASHLIREKAPRVQISAAVFPKLEDSVLLKHQDWGTWAKQGWVDFLAPMTLTSAEKVVEEDTLRVLKQTAEKLPVYAGIFGPFNGNSAETVLAQIESAQKSGAKGFVIFDAAHLSGRDLKALKASYGRQNARFIEPYRIRQDIKHAL